MKEGNHKSGTAKFVIIGIGSLIVITILVLLIVSTVTNVYNDLDGSIAGSEDLIVLGTEQTLAHPPQNLIATTPENSWLTFDGVNDAIITTALPLIKGSNFSISFWAYFPNNASEGHIFGNRWNSTEQFALGKRDTNTFIQGALYNGSSGGYSGGATTNIITPVGEWLHIVYKVNETQSAIYGSDGKTNLIMNNIVYNENANFGGATTPYLILGDRQDSPNNPIEMSLDEVRIYNTTLTNSQITEIYNSGLQANSSLPSDGLVLWYSFNENSGTTVYDKSGNLNHGE